MRLLITMTPYKTRDGLSVVLEPGLMGLLHVFVQSDGKYVCVGHGLPSKKAGALLEMIIECNGGLA